MGLWYLLNMGGLSALVALFYLVIVPIWLIRLGGRIKTLERRLDESPQATRVKKVPASPGTEMLGPPPVSMERESKPSAQVRTTPKKPGAEQSFEQKLGGHWFQWIGIAALVAGLIFFLKWSFDNGLIGPTGRTVIGYVLSAGAMLAGDRLRGKYGNWALAFTGGGALGSFIVTWIALHSYHLFPMPIGYALFVLTTAVTCLLAGYYGALALAAFGILGGFLTPFLTGGAPSTMGILTYVLILDLGILTLGHMRQWRVLNTLGLLGTLLYETIALFDGRLDNSYGIAFAAAFLALYTLVPYVYNLLNKQKSTSADILVLIANAVAHFCLLLQWLDDFPGYHALLALGFAVLYLVFSSEVFRRNRTDTPLVLGSLSLTVLFAAIAVPLQFGGAWVPLAWSVEACFLLWMALTLRDPRIQRFGWIVMITAYAWYLFNPEGGQPLVFLNAGFFLFLAWALLMVAIGIGGLGRSDRGEQQIVPFMLVGFTVLTLSLCMNLFVETRSALTGLERFIETAALVGGGYLVLLRAKNVWKTLTADERSMFSVLGVALQIITLTYLTDEFVNAVNDGRLFSNFPRPRQALQVGISMLWAVYGAVALVVGIVQNWKPLRMFSLVLLLVATAKLTLVDLFSLGTGARVIGFTTLGAILVTASFLYQRKKEMFHSLFAPSSNSK